MITVEHLNYEYPGKRALIDISFQIKSGSITALVGPNGAGKTTLLKCMAALAPPFSGGIHIDGINVVKQPRECHKIVGFLPDFFGLYDQLTLYQSLSYFARAQNMPADRIKSRVHEVVDSLNLKEKLHERIGSLSRGMRQRLAIGQAMIHDPKVLLLDEPASGLDPEARYSLAKLFLKLNREGKTLVVSSHILAELEQYATDVLILKGGRIIDNSITFSGSTVARKIRIQVLDVPENIREILESTENIENVKINDHSISMDFTGDKEGQHALLKRLLDSRIGVIEFYVKKEGVQEQYLESVSSSS